MSRSAKLARDSGPAERLAELRRRLRRAAGARRRILPGAPIRMTRLVPELEPRDPAPALLAAGPVGEREPELELEVAQPLRGMAPARAARRRVAPARPVLAGRKRLRIRLGLETSSLRR